MAQDRSNVKAGIFVLAGIILFVAVIITLSDLQSLFRPAQKLEVKYRLSDGLWGLAVGSQVAVGHEPIGTVTRITDGYTEGRLTHKFVVFEVPADLTLYDNARIELVVPPLGGGTYLNISSVGFEPTADQVRQVADDRVVGPTGQARLGESWVLEPGDPPLSGQIAGSHITESFAGDMGIGDRQRRKLQTIIDNVEQFTEGLAGATPTDQLAGPARRWRATAEDLRSTIAGLKQLSQGLAGDVPDGQLTPRARRIADTIAHLEQVTGRVNTVMAAVERKYEQWVGGITDIIASARDGADRITQMIDENRPVVRDGVAYARDTFDNTRAITAEFRNKTLEKVQGLIGQAGESFGKLKETVSEVKGLVVTQKPVVERMLANLRLTSDQLKLTAVEVRRTPWRLLYTPSEKELESENLYDAARSYTMAVGTLDSTVQSLQSMLQEYGAEIDPQDSNLQLILDNLHDNFEKFAEAEDRFWEVLKGAAEDR